MQNSQWTRRCVFAFAIGGRPIRLRNLESSSNNANEINASTAVWCRGGLMLRSSCEQQFAELFVSFARAHHDSGLHRLRRNQGGLYNSGAPQGLGESTTRARRGDAPSPRQPARRSQSTSIGSSGVSGAARRVPTENPEGQAPCEARAPESRRPPASGRRRGSNTMIAIVIGLVTLLLGGGLAGGALYISRRSG